jgi:hypothetical protein
MATWPAVGMVVGQAYRLRGSDDSSGERVVDAAVRRSWSRPARFPAVLGLSRSGGFQPRLQFNTEASALAHVEVYGGTAGMPLSVVFEVSKRPMAPLFPVPGVLSAIGRGPVLATGTIPVGSLSGDYVIRAIIGVKDQPAGQPALSAKSAERPEPLTEKTPP